MGGTTSFLCSGGCALSVLYPKKMENWWRTDGVVQNGRHRSLLAFDSHLAQYCAIGNDLTGNVQNW